MPHVGHDAKHHVAYLYAIAYAIETVVGNVKRGDGETTQRNGFTFFNQFHARRVNLATHAIVVVDANVNGKGGVDGYVEVTAHASHGFHVVCMVVRDNHVVDAIQGNAIIFQAFPHGSNPNASVNQESVSFRVQKITIATTSAP